MSEGSFQDQWLARFGLSRRGWRNELGAQLAERPFVDPAEARPLLEYLFSGVPELLARDASDATRQLAEAFGWACYAFWQCGSMFPAFAENYAGCLAAALRGEPAPAAGLVAQLLVASGPAGSERCGFNQLALRDAALIRESERLIHDGRYEEYLHASEKYAEYEQALRDSPEFQADWQALKRAFPRQTRGTVHRTLGVERNWVRGPGPSFSNKAKSFQPLFDLFCWKYYLWAMCGDEPLLMKPSVVVTPLGTQIFIPGYLSFDPKRDLKLGKVAQLHRARGIPRQGPGFSVGRSVLADQRKKAKAADAIAKQRGLKGDARYDFIARAVGIRDPDFRKVRKLLE